MNRNQLPEDDPRLLAARQNLSHYTDEYGNLTDEQKKKYTDMVLAIDSITGDILADAPDKESLRIAVDNSEFRGRMWRLVDGPTSEN